MKKKYKIFDIDYLQNAEFTDEDLYFLFDTASFNYSLVIAMFKKYTKELLTDDKIINIVRTDNHWMYKRFWNKAQREEFIEILKKCFYNLYRYSDSICESIAGLWIVQFGFTSAKQKKKKMLLLED